MYPARTLPIERSISLVEARSRFLEDLCEWADSCILDLAHTAVDNHDQGTLHTSWRVLVEQGMGGELLPWLKAQRDAIKCHHEGRGLWRHGYWKEQEAHHGTEHFELFLASLWRMDPTDGETVRQFVDAAEHIGNWVDDIPAWFDWENGVFRSMFLGTARVGQQAASAINVPDHLRCVNLCLIAHEMTGEERYLELAILHGSRWADAILGGDELPVGLGPQGEGIYRLDGGTEAAYRKFAGMIPADLDDLGRAENFFASNGVQTFMDLSRFTGEASYRDAAEALLDVLIPCLGDPDAGCLVAMIWSHMRQTGSQRYAPILRETLRPMGSVQVESVTIEPEVIRKTQPAGVGKRRDMPVWLHDGEPRRISPVHLAHLAMMEADSVQAVHALDLARTMFHLARQVFPCGRHHGCSARTVNAAARGHGRDNNVGLITGVLEPLLGGGFRASEE